MILPLSTTSLRDPMGYYVRAFCLARNAPTLAEMLQWLAEREVKLSLEDQRDRDQAQSPQWHNAALTFEQGKPPILIECDRNDGDNSLARQEIQAFLDKIGAPGRSTAKRRVAAHLKGTKFIIACKLPVEEMDERAWDANGQVLTFLVERCEALIQADREGFYERSNLILPLA